jgi:hypothetical protein
MVNHSAPSHKPNFIGKKRFEIGDVREMLTERKDRTTAARDPDPREIPGLDRTKRKPPLLLNLRRPSFSLGSGWQLFRQPDLSAPQFSFIPDKWLFLGIARCLF